MIHEQHKHRNKDRHGKSFFIIKRNIVVNKHHGGAWKVAYADFITAMMAFFLMLWLLNSTPSQELKNIASHFEPTIGLFQKKYTKDDNTQDEDEIKTTGILYGVKESGQIVSMDHTGAEQLDNEIENEALNLIAQNISNSLEKNIGAGSVSDNITFEQLPEGLLIQIADLKGGKMFDPGSDKLLPATEAVLKIIARLIQYSPNFITIGGHTERSDDISRDYTTWELSADRANSARRFLVANGIAVERIAKLIAYGDSAPLNENDQYNPQNRRISILLMRNSTVPSYKTSVPRNIGLKQK